MEGSLNTKQKYLQKISFEEPEIAKRVAELDKKFELTYYPEKSQPLIEKYGLS